MCLLCKEYGNPNVAGGIWYLNPNNHARNMYKLRLPGEGFKGADAGLETGVRTGPTIVDLLAATEEGDYNKYTKFQQEMQARGQGSQVVPLNDADKILELSSPIGLIGCICRRDWRAIDERNEHEYTCMEIGRAHV